MNSKITLATLGGGCFWCTEAIYNRLIGVKSVVPGYSGGNTKNPTYEEVCSEKTNHAEVIQLSFSEDEISYKDLISIFLQIHDPTQLNKQGPDVGTQYRSVIFYHDLKQKEIAELVKNEIEKSKMYKNPIVTEITAFSEFYPAEENHKEFYEKNEDNSYCQFVVRKKVEHFQEIFKKYLKKK